MRQSDKNASEQADISTRTDRQDAEERGGSPERAIYCLRPLPPKSSLLRRARCRHPGCGRNLINAHPWPCGDDQGNDEPRALRRMEKRQRIKRRRVSSVRKPRHNRPMMSSGTYDTRDMDPVQRPVSGRRVTRPGRRSSLLAIARPPLVRPPHLIPPDASRLPSRRPAVPHEKVEQCVLHLAGCA